MYVQRRRDRRRKHLCSADCVISRLSRWGLRGVTHALWAKGNLDIDRSTPGSNSDDPAYTSLLSSAGLALKYQAGTDTAGFAATSVPALLANATAVLTAQKDRSLRRAFHWQRLDSAVSSSRLLRSHSVARWRLCSGSRMGAPPPLDSLRVMPARRRPTGRWRQPPISLKISVRHCHRLARTRNLRPSVRRGPAALAL